MRIDRRLWGDWVITLCRRKKAVQRSVSATAHAVASATEVQLFEESRKGITHGREENRASMAAGLTWLQPFKRSVKLRPCCCFPFAYVRVTPESNNDETATLPADGAHPARRSAR